MKLTDYMKKIEGIYKEAAPEFIKIVKKDLMLDYECLVNYIVDVLKGHLKDKYSAPEGRITIV